LLACDVAFFAVKQVFDRQSAVEHYRSFTAEHGVVNLDASCFEKSCDGGGAVGDEVSHG